MNFLFILFLLLLIPNQEINQKAQNSDVENKSIKDKTFLDKIVAVVNGEIISYTEVEELIIHKRMRENLDIFNYPESVFGNALNEIIDEKILLQASKKEEIQIEEERIDIAVENYIKNLRRQYPDEKKFKESLRKENLTLEKLKSILKKQEEKDYRIREVVSKKISTTSQEIEDFKNKLRREKIPLSRFLVSHILIRCSENADENELAEKKQRAIQVLLEYENGKVSFAELAKKYSEDVATRDNEADLGILNEGEFLKEIEESLNKMSVGEVFGPIRTKLGFHILFLRDCETPERKLYIEKYKIERENWLKQLRTQARIKILWKGTE